MNPNIICSIIIVVILIFFIIFQIHKNVISGFDKASVILFNNFDDGVIIIDLKGKVQQLNSSAKLIFNLNENEIDDLNIKNVIPFYDENKNYHNYELDAKLFRKYIILTQIDFKIKKKVKGKILVFRDITDAKIVNEIRHRYEFIVNATNDLMALIRKDLTFSIINKSFIKVFSGINDEIINMKISDVFNYESYSKMIKHIERCFKGNIVVFKDWFNFGSVKNRFFEISLYPYINSEYDVTQCIFISRDITELKLGEDIIQESNISLEKMVIQRTTELKSSEKRYRGIVDNIPALIRRCLPETYKITYINDMYCNFFSFNKDEIIGKSILELFHGKDKEIFLDNVSKLSYKNPVVTYDSQMKTKNESKWIRWTYQALFSGENKIVEYQAIGFDLTEKIKSEEKLKNANYMMQQLINSISSILIGINSEKIITHFNPVAEKTFNFKYEEVINKNFNTLNVDWDWDKILLSLDSCIVENIPVRLDILNYKDKDNNNRILGINLNPINNLVSKKVEGVIIWGADITERKLMEMQLSQSQKLESIGQLAAGIAHEINTPVQYIGDNINFLKDVFINLEGLIGFYNELLDELKSNKVKKDTINQIVEMERKIDINYLLKEIPSAIVQSLEGVERVSKIVKSMRDFSHPGLQDKSLTDINKSIESTITISRNEWKYVSDVETNFDNNLPSVLCNPGEINQVILNIIINAAHSIEDIIKINPNENKKGKIIISTKSLDKFIEISIADTGAGIPKNVQEKVFEQFFTTKGVGKGTGQGLTIAYTIIVKKHSGKIFFQTEEGKGTTFYIQLPI